MSEFTIDAVFEGGGIKGIALAGALMGIEEACRLRGDTLVVKCVAGTSAGAIVAALVAAGYTGSEIVHELKQLDYKQFRDKGIIDHIPVIGPIISLGGEHGIYEGNYFEQWIDKLLEKKNIRTFADLKDNNPATEEKYRYRLQVIASSLTERRYLVLPRDFQELGCIADKHSVAHAVRMSMSIPLFFEPVPLIDGSGRKHIIVDGGLLSNYPIWLLDDGTPNPPWPTIGFRLSNPNRRTELKPQLNPFKSVSEFIQSLISTMLDAHDTFHISRSTGDLERTILIDSTVPSGRGRKNISSLDFDIEDIEVEALINNGRNAALQFMQTWDFPNWTKKFRQHTAQAQPVQKTPDGKGAEK